MSTTVYAERARAKKMADAQAVGIDDALISNMVEHFYDAVRQDELLGPIFAARVPDWAPHLARMKDFWASITLEPGRFRGNPMLKHVAIGGLEKPHFDRWLALWRHTVNKVVSDDAAASLFHSAANRIAQSLLIGIQIQRGGLGAVAAAKGDDHADGF